MKRVKVAFWVLFGAWLNATSHPSFAAPVSMVLSRECVLRLVAGNYGVTLNSSFPLPELFTQSRTPLKQFQDAIEPQWGFRPDAFTNAFAVAKNEIYLLDDESYYSASGRTIDDSLAHELVHYLQVRYRGYDLNQEEFSELEAITVQTWFRNTVMTSADPTQFCRD